MILNKIVLLKDWYDFFFVGEDSIITSFNKFCFKILLMILVFLEISNPLFYMIWWIGLQNIVFDLKNHAFLELIILCNFQEIWWLWSSWKLDIFWRFCYSLYICIFNCLVIVLKGAMKIFNILLFLNSFSQIRGKYK